MKKEEVKSTNAPAAIGPYSQGIEINDMIYLSGQLPIDPKTGKFSGNDIKSQTTQSFENIKAILEDLGLSMNHIVKTTVFLQDLNDFAEMNAIYETYFKTPYPARSAFEVAALPKGAKVEIEIIAHK